MIDGFYLKMITNDLWYNGKGYWVADLERAFRFKNLKEAQTSQFMLGRENCQIIKLETLG